MNIIETVKNWDLGTKISVSVLVVSLIFSAILISGNNQNKNLSSQPELEQINISDNLSGILINQNAISLENGTNYLISTDITPQSADGAKLKYESSNEEVALVNELGLIKTKGIGSATIKVISVDNKEIGDQITVNVVNAGVEVKNIKLSETKLSLAPDQTREIKTTIEPENAVDKSIDWNSSNSEIATVDNFGKVTAKKEGKATIVAKSKNGISVSCEVEVFSAEVGSVELTKENLTIKKGEVYKVSAIIKPENAKDKSVVWSSSNSSVASVDNSGKITGLSPGTATVMAKSNNNKTDSVVVIVREEIVVVTTIAPTVSQIYPTDISVDVESVNLYPNEKQQIVAVVEPNDSTNKTVTWLTDNKNVASVSRNGLITALNTGTATITAKTVNNKMARVLVTVNEDQSAPTGVSLSATSVNIYVGERQQINAKVDPDTARDKTLTWTSDNTNVASVDSNGLITGVNIGSATVTVVTINGKTTRISVNVNQSNEPEENENEPVEIIDNIEVQSIALNVKNVFLAPNKRQQITVVFTPNNASNKTISWSSSNSNVATVTGSGLVTAMKSGSAVITVRSVNGKTQTAKITVTGSTSIPTPIVSTPTQSQPTPTTVVVSTDPPIEPPAGANIVQNGRSTTLIASIEKKSSYYITRIWAKDPVNQFKKAITSGWGSYFETVNTMADREVSTKGLQNKIMVAINASAWHTPDVDKVSGYNYTSYGTLCLVDGQIKRNDSTNTSYRAHNYYTINGKGDLQVFTDNKTNRSTLYQTIINAGVKNTFSFGLAEIVFNGNVNLTQGGAEAKRQTFCQINKNNFAIVTVTGDKTVYEAAVILRDIGCKTAVNFDGGSSIRLVFKKAGDSTVTTVTGGARKVADIFYVTE